MIELRYLLYLLQTGNATSIGDVVAGGRAAVEKLIRLDEPTGARAKVMLASALLSQGQADQARQVLREAREYADHVGFDYLHDTSNRIEPATWLWGGTSVNQAIALCRELLATEPTARVAASAYRTMAVLLAMRGDFDHARELLRRDDSILVSLGLETARAGMRGFWGIVELLSDNPGDATRVLEPALDWLRRRSEKLYSQSIAALLAQAFVLQGCIDEANAMCEQAEHTGARDIASVIRALCVRAIIEASKGDSEYAVRLATRAIATASRTDHLNDQADAYFTAARVQMLGRDTSASEKAAREAIALYTRKGNLVSETAARRLIGEA
jgi:tetratricopeptide (TPR) repeat protein